MLRRLAIVFLLLVTAALGGGLAPARAQTTRIAVVEVSGLIDPVMVDFVKQAITNAEAAGVEALVIRLDSRGAVVPQPEVDRLAVRVRNAEVPVAVWVGESRGAVAFGGAFELVEAAAIAGAAPGTRLGRSPLAEGFEATLTAEEALEAGVLEVDAPTLGDFILALDGRRAGGSTIEIPTEVVRQGDTPQRQLAEGVVVGFAEPSFVAQLLHGVATPSATYVLLVVGMLLIVFEFFTVGVGIAGGVGALSLVLGAYGAGVLPTSVPGLVLLAVAVVGVGIDLQAGAPRAWTVIGTVAFAIGSLLLFPGYPVPVVALLLATAGFLVFALSAMPAMIRTRFSTPTIGRESMVGEEGVALTPVDPDGTVEIRLAKWRARTNRATPIPAGDGVRVVSIDGLLLEVEPLTGGARDAGH